MEEIEHFMKIMQQRRLVNQRELERFDIDCDEHVKLMRDLQSLKKDRDKYKNIIIEQLKVMTAHKHTIHKVIQSSEDISGLPVPQEYLQEIKTMFTDAISFLNNIGDTYKDNIHGKSMEPSKLIQDVTTCTEAVGNELYQTRCRIAQLETLKEDIAVLQQRVLNSSNISDASVNVTINGESTMEELQTAVIHKD